MLDFEQFVWIRINHLSVFLCWLESPFNTKYYIYCIFQLSFSHGTRVALIIVKTKTTSPQGWRKNQKNYFIGVVVFNKKQMQLRADIYLKCFVCNEHEARHICIFEWNGFDFKLCLCPQCVTLNKQLPTTDLLQKVA
jgi:hypothetical protein